MKLVRDPQKEIIIAALTERMNSDPVLCQVFDDEPGVVSRTIGFDPFRFKTKGEGARDLALELAASPPLLAVYQVGQGTRVGDGAIEVYNRTLTVEWIGIMPADGGELHPYEHATNAANLVGERMQVLLDQDGPVHSPFGVTDLWSGRWIDDREIGAFEPYLLPRNGAFGVDLELKIRHEPEAYLVTESTVPLQEVAVEQKTVATDDGEEMQHDVEIPITQA